MNEELKLQESILDPINNERCKEIFSNDKMLPEVRKFILTIIRDFISQLDFEAEVENVYMIGSSTGYQYTLTSDIDIEVETNIKKEQMKKFWGIVPKGKVLPGTQKPVNIFLMFDGEKYDFKNAENVYDVVNQKFLKETPKDKFEVPYQYIKDLSTFFMNGCDLAISKFEGDKREINEYLSLDPETQEISEKEKSEAIDRKLVDIKNDVDTLKMAHHVIFSFEQEGYEGMPFKISIEMEKRDDGRFSVNNLVYKMLDKNNYLERLFNSINDGKELIKKVEENAKKLNEEVVKYVFDTDEKTEVYNLINDVIDQIKNIKYGFVSLKDGSRIEDREFIHNCSSDELRDLYATNWDPEITLKNNLGICVDQCVAIKYLMNKLHPEIPVQLYALYKGRFGHCVCTFELNGKYWYIENAWDKMYGLHGPFNSKEELEAFLDETYHKFHDKDNDCEVIVSEYNPEELNDGKKVLQETYFFNEFVEAGRD